MNHHQVRQLFQNYFSTKNYVWTKSASLIPKTDPSILFTNAGMNPFKNYFLGLTPPPHPHLCSIQKCLRAGGKHNDLEQVGYSLYHHTFFEMLGFFSFNNGDKKKAINHAIDFLTNHLGLSKDNLWVSVLKADKTTATIWHKIHKFPLKKIFLLDEQSNFWRMGDTGPCGPCTEIYYYNGSKKNPTHNDMIEIWNLVFMEFNEDSTGKRTKLPSPCIDTGMGLERLVAILQKQKNNYHTDLFKQIIMSISEVSDIKYDFNSDVLNKHQIAFRVIADHCRSICFLISDGILPGSDKAPYVLRRILRRALFYSHKLSTSHNLLIVATQTFISLMDSIYPILNSNKLLILSTIKQESTLFTQSLNIGKNILLQKMNTLKNKKIDNNTVWELYSTYGFPPDLTHLIAQEKQFSVETLSLEELKKKHNFLISKQHKNKKLHFKNYLPQIIQKCNVQNIKFTGFNSHTQDSQILCLFTIKDFNLCFISHLQKDQQAFLVVHETCFYPEGGGPIGDQGIVITKTGTAQVLDCQKEDDFIFHTIKILKGSITSQQLCTMTVDTKHRKLITGSHSATHLLHQALRTLLGSSIRQMGSLIKPGELRFDFNHNQPLNKKQINILETTIKNYISSQHKVYTSSCSYKEAIKNGALSLLGENYTQQVRVIKIGESQELCGGIHVKNSKDIKDFKIISESGVQSGVRRITAYTGDKLQHWFALLEKQNICFREYLKLPVVKIAENHNPLINHFQKKEEQIINLKQKIKTHLQKKILSNSQKITPNSTLTNAQKILSNSQILVQQNEELRHYLNIPLPKEEPEPQNIFIPFMKKKEEQIQLLQKQLNNLNTSINLDVLIKTAKKFQYENQKGYLLSVFIPVSDKKLLAEIADQLKFKIPSTNGIVIVLGQNIAEKKQYPLIITITKPLTGYICAAHLFKNTVAPFLDGKGGGQARFAQGTIINNNLFPSLEQELLKTLNKTS